MNNAKEYIITIYFREIGWQSTIADMYGGGRLLNTTYFKEKDISTIKYILKGLFDAFEIDDDNVEYKTSSETMNRITQRTLSNTKTVWELFSDLGIEIKEATKWNR